jgi:hypothetical protein
MELASLRFDEIENVHLSFDSYNATIRKTDLQLSSLSTVGSPCRVSHSMTRHCSRIAEAEA